MRLSKIFLTSLAVLTMFSCRKDSSSDPILIDNMMPIDVLNSYTIDVQGFVTTPDGIPIQDALIQVENQQVTTTEAGTFYLEKLIAPETGLYLLADADGFFKGGSTVYSHSNNIYTVNIVLTPYDQLISFDSSEGIDMTNPDGTKLNIQGNSIVDANGLPYDGPVEAYMNWIDPTADNMPALSPGPLVGIQGDEIRALRSYGMIGVEMFGPSGQELNINESIGAEISFPVPNDILASAPTEIDLWHFDEALGLWELEGVATLTNGSYEASVPHFSWWNCDIPFDFTFVCFNLVDDLGRPLGNLNLNISTGDFGTANAWVDQTGMYCNLVPLGEDLNVSVETYCGDVLVSEIFPPVSNGDEITITVSLGSSESSNLNVSGNITCGAAGAVTNGFVLMSVGNQTYVDYVDQDGNYSIDFVSCSVPGATATLTAFDLDGLTNGAVVVDILDDNIVQNIDGCNDNLGEQTMIVTSTGNADVFMLCEANVTTAEITIIAKNPMDAGSYVILGVDGFGMGSHTGNVFSTIQSLSSFEAEQGLVNIEITSYSDVPGEKIAGTFEFMDVTATFIAVVQ